MEDRSETEVRAEGESEHGRGGYGCGVATAAAEGGMEWGRDPSRVCQRAGRTVCRGRACEDRRFYARDGRAWNPARWNCPWSFGVGKTDAGTAWVDALRAEVGVAAAWLPRRARAFQVVVAFEDDAGGRWGGGRRRAQRRFRRNRIGFRRLLFPCLSNPVLWGMRSVRRRPQLVRSHPHRR